MKNFILILVFFIQSVFLFGQSSISKKVTNFPIPIFTNSNLSLVILNTAWEKFPKQGDEISVIDSDGQIVGNSIVLVGHNGMPIWGDNPNTILKDGLATGEHFRIIHWDHQNDIYHVFDDFSIQTGSITYIKDGFTIVTSLRDSEIYDRPTDVYFHTKSVLSESSIFSFYVKDPGIYSLHVYSSDSTLFAKGDLDCNKGYYSFNYEENLQPSNYTIELKSVGKVVASKQFTVELSN